ncbi:MAG: biotin--[acetyl-CoA-carboxylase] ligase [Caldiserica bacterium]|nr:biotin--[acetyl-CoA-carboxylase] ligase [Caldisericota bacterium]
MELLTYSNIASTQDTARHIALDGHLLPFAVIAEVQSQGRGRRGRSWDSPKGGLWLTLALAVPSAETVRQSAMVTAHAVASSVLTETGIRTLVKWPNDLLVGRCKVCGILAETLVQTGATTLLVGIGLNVNNIILHDQLPRAAPLRGELGRILDLQHLRASILSMVEQDLRMLILHGFDTFVPWMNANLALRGELVTVEFNDQRESGRVAGLSRTGALLLENPDGSLKEVDAGSVYDW